MPEHQSLTELEGTDEFIARHIGPMPAEQDVMLEAIGAASLDALISETVPASILLDAPLDLPGAVTERAALARLREVAAENVVMTSLIGQGYSDTITPAVIQRNVLENPAWYTSYTPYQPEISQGRLEALLNYQTLVADLTGLPLANASLLDEATAAAEAMTMARRATQSDSAVVFVGVPSSLGAKYFAVPTAAEHAVEGRPAGRACFDCVPKGLDKSHCVSHLLKRGAVVAGRAIAMGDQPKGNDEGLTRWHRHATVDIPFVSVSEEASIVPEHLAECHVTAASNAEGSALVLGALADLLEAGTIELSSDAVSTLVRDLNRGDLNRGATEGRGGMM